MNAEGKKKAKGGKGGVQLFQPMTLRGVTMRNRIWLPPMDTYSAVAQDGKPTPFHYQHYVSRVYHMENQELNRYVGDYDHFQEVYAVKKAQLEAAYRRQQQEISELKDFVARNKARVSTRNMAMSRQKKLDKMDVIELAAEKPKPEFHFKESRTPGRFIFQTKDLVIGYDSPLTKSPLNLTFERNQKVS